jgi:putative Mg2+ transporter-C (MgtC) family protein
MKLVNTMEIEFFGVVSIYFGLGVQVLMALLLGGIVGYDREKKLKAAGLKTNILICIGSALYTSIGYLVTAGAEGISDPNRMAAQIVSGIGFLGAGAIIQGRGNVIGLTTAATIWVVAAIGFTIGAGYPFTAAIFSVTVLVVLKLINPIYFLLEREKDRSYFQLEVLSKGTVRRTVSGIIFKEMAEVVELYEEDWDSKGDKIILNVFLLAHARQMERILAEINSALKVEKVAYHGVENGGRHYKVFDKRKDT